MPTEQSGEDIAIVDTASRPWRHDGEGYPGLEDLEADPDRLPESDGMGEDESEEDATLPVHQSAVPLASPPSSLPASLTGSLTESLNGSLTASIPAASAPASPPLDSEPPPRGAIPGWNGMGPHLDELRRRLIVSLAVFVPLFGIGLWLYRPLWNVVTLPLERAAPHLLRFQALTPSDGLIMAMRIAFAFALFLSLPVWLAQLLSFISPGLTASEKTRLHLGLAAGGGLFLLGVGIAYFAGIPLALGFLLPFNQSLPGWENAFTGAGYVDFIIVSCAGFGLAFELPLVMAALGWVGILTPEGLREWMRPAILIIVILAAILTPPDPFTQMILALPMLLLFFVGCRLVRWTSRINSGSGSNNKQ